MNLPEIEYFFTALFIYYLGYKVVDYLYQNDNCYKCLKPDRKEYFQKNIVKTIALIFISLFGSKIIYNGIILNQWNNSLIHRIGYLYSALDVLGLIIVKGLPFNSKVHHLSTLIFSYLNTTVDYQTNTFWVGLPVYCILSCYAFGVNYYLAYRLIRPNNLLLINYNIVSYFLLLLVNWAYQFLNIINVERITWDVILFISLILFVANDDIKLIKFMVYQRTKMLKKTEEKSFNEI